MRTVPVLITAGILCLAIPVRTHAQGGRGGDAAAAPALSPKDAAATDLTGYWVSIVTEDWRFRMVTPKKGDYASVPLNDAGKKMADTWDPDKDTAAGEQCRSYGAPAVMRVPGRVHITWANDNTLRIDTDAGTQTRLLHFGKVQPQGSPSLQGDSVANWDVPETGRGRGVAAKAGAFPGGSLKVVTTHLRPGYLRKNGVPYSANAVLTEYFSHTKEPNGDEWLIVTTVVEDPQYLTTPFITSTHFKKIPDASGWNPTPCAAK
jgi:hypothetical protein